MEDKPSTEARATPPDTSHPSRPTTKTSLSALRSLSDDASQTPPRLASATINQTIQDLENLLAEAVKLVEQGGKLDNTIISVSGRRSQLPHPSLAVDANAPRHVSFSGKTKHPQKGDLEESNSIRSQDSSKSALTCRGACSADKLLLLEPRPIVEGPEGSPDSTAENASLASRSRLRVISRLGKTRFQHRPEINARTTSVRVGRRGRQQELAVRPFPRSKLASAYSEDDLDKDKDDIPAEEDSFLRARPGHERHYSHIFAVNSRQGSMHVTGVDRASPIYKIDLNGTRHVDVPEGPDDFDVYETSHHAPIARNWPSSRKRLSACVSCFNTACVGLILGVYSGEVPAIQYVIVDFDRVAILGNVALYMGLAISTMVFWPLPLLHGRKFYTLCSLLVALCLQIPQGLALGSFRDPDMTRYRTILLTSRAVLGLALGFANINSFATLLDVFGASLQSSSADDGVLNPHDVRRHGGGQGVWLAIWSWCNIGSIALGFMLGAFIISGTSVDWGFWVILVVLMIATLLNLVAPEVRRSAFRRTIQEMMGEQGGFSRVGRGEVKMHLTGNGPYWWGEEVKAGLQLSWRMVKQPGFLLLSIYTAWVYAQFTLILMVSP